MVKIFNLSKLLSDKSQIINEADLQSGEIEFSMTGELIPVEKVKFALEESIHELINKISEYMGELSVCRCMKQQGKYCLDCEILQAKSQGIQEAIDLLNNQEEVTK